MTRRFLALNYTAYGDRAGVQANDPVNAWTGPTPVLDDCRLSGSSFLLKPGISALPRAGLYSADVME